MANGNKRNSHVRYAHLRNCYETASVSIRLGTTMHEPSAISTRRRSSPIAPSLSDAPKTGSLIVIFLTVFIDLLGFGMVLPLLPIYAKHFVTDEHGLLIGLLMASFSAMQFLFAPVWGRLSDRIGRRPVLMIGLAGSIVFNALFGVATVMGSIVWLFVARIGAGIAGANIPITQAYIADTTSVRKSGQRHVADRGGVRRWVYVWAAGRKLGGFGRQRASGAMAWLFRGRALDARARRWRGSCFPNRSSQGARRRRGDCSTPVRFAMLWPRRQSARCC